MDRRNFIVGCASGAVTATALSGRTLSAQTASSDTHTKAISHLMACKQLEMNGNIEQCVKTFHPDGLRVEPSTLGPIRGREAIGQGLQKNARERKLLYHHYRQPQVVSAGNCALVISNYEAGYESGGKTIEESGKCSNVVVVGSSTPAIANEMLVPNIHAGGYGPLGTALSSPPLGIYPRRALNLETENKGAGGGLKDALYAEVQRINEAWRSGDANEVLKHANSKGVFLIGDYSPFFVTGNDEIKQHFADFYKTSKVNSIRSFDPTVQLWGDAATVYFSFDLDYILGGKPRKSPGRAVFTFTLSGGTHAAADSRIPISAFRPFQNSSPSVTVCTASHVVTGSIGDTYPS